MSATNMTAVPGCVDDITKPWVLQILNNIDSEVNITQVDIKGPIGEEHGVMSDLVAILAKGNKNGKEERYSLVVKLTSFRWIMESAEHMSVEDYLMFDTAEVKFYSVAVPDFLSLLVESLEFEGKFKEDGFDQSCLIDDLSVPKCYFTASDQASKMSVRVLENLKTQGYSIKPYPQTLDLEEMELAVGALARIHGLSHRLELQSGTPLPDRYDWIVDIFNRKQQRYAKHYREGLEIFAAAFPENEDLLECLGKLDGAAIVKEAAENPARVKVLCHADCWNNNIMFKYEDGRPVDVKLVDWQMVSYRPPTFDLVLLFMYQTWDIFHNHRHAILEHYYLELQKTLGENNPWSSYGWRSGTHGEVTFDNLRHMEKWCKVTLPLCLL